MLYHNYDIDLRVYLLLIDSYDFVLRVSSKKHETCYVKIRIALENVLMIIEPERRDKIFINK